MKLNYFCFFLLVFFVGTSFAVAESPIPDEHRIAPESPEALRRFFTLREGTNPRTFGTPPRTHLIDAHRGGARKGLPENSLEIFEDTLKRMPAMFEIDLRLTKDDIIVLMHDPTIDRTTNGTGNVKDYTYKELQQFRLKDPLGNVTDFRIPAVTEVIKWARGKTILFLDRKDVSVERTLQMLRELDAESYCLLMFANIEGAKKCYDANNNVMMELFITDLESVERFEKSGMPWENVLPFVGFEEPAPELYEALHKRNRPCMIGCARAIDRSVRQTGDNSIFRKINVSGASILETDLPVQAADALKK